MKDLSDLEPGSNKTKDKPRQVSFSQQPIGHYFQIDKTPQEESKIKQGLSKRKSLKLEDEPLSSWKKGSQIYGLQENQ